MRRRGKTGDQGTTREAARIESIDIDTPTAATDHAAQVEIETVDENRETVTVDTPHQHNAEVGVLQVGAGETNTSILHDR